MTPLATFLIAVGIADVIRRLTSREGPAAAAGIVTVLACAALAGLRHAGDSLPLLAAAGCLAWVWLGAHTEHTGRRHGAALTTFGATTALLVLMSGWSSPVGGALSSWLHWAGFGIAPGRVLMIIGVLLLQLVTGNVLVRIVLGAIGAVRPVGQPQPSDRLKGGRLLGPMERLLIVGLGLGGQLGAASAVVAPKGIIRFPELNAQRKDHIAGAVDDGPGIDEVTEYFLVGSFASWIVAMAGLALTLQ